MEEKKFYQKLWFWAILIISLLIIILIAQKYIEQKKLEKSFEDMGRGASDYVKGINNSESHINEFTYNYETNTVEYKPKK